MLHLQNNFNIFLEYLWSKLAEGLLVYDALMTGIFMHAHDHHTHLRSSQVAAWSPWRAL